MVACVFAHLHQVTASSTRVRFFRALVATVMPDQLIQFGLIGVVGGVLATVLGKAWDHVPPQEPLRQQGQRARPAWHRRTARQLVRVAVVGLNLLHEGAARRPYEDATAQETDQQADVVVNPYGWLPSVARPLAIARSTQPLPVGETYVRFCQ